MEVTETITVSADSINRIIVAPLIQRIDDLINLDENLGLLKVDLRRMSLVIKEISTAFEGQQRPLPTPIQITLERMANAIEEVRSLIDRVQVHQRWLRCIFCRPRISRQIREWNTRFDYLCEDLQRDFTICLSTQQILSSAKPQVEAIPLLQPVPDWGLVGSGIKVAEAQLQTWVTGAPHVRIIGVYGMAGVGKTSLLKMLYNYNKVSDVFDVVIWAAVSQNYTFSELQNCVAQQIGLDLSDISDNDTRKKMMFASLQNKKYLLILDDIWSRSLHLEELGIPLEANIGSKVVVSSRTYEDIRETEESIRMMPLAREEAWALFGRIAFRGSDVPKVEVEEYARVIADECKGLPLAITVVASAMRDKKSEAEWKTALYLMKNAASVDEELYQSLKWIYDVLHETPNLQKCFLSCALYPKDMRINVDILVRMWIAEGYIKSEEGNYSSDIASGHRYVKLLISRGLFQNVNVEKESIYNVKIPVNIWKSRYITVSNVIRDMTIYIGEKEENYFCRAGLQLQELPRSPTQDCERISMQCNQIKYLPTDFQCPKLVSLILSTNPLTWLPESFLMNLSSLRVLDLSDTHIPSVPTSVCQLTQLEFLTLKNTKIRYLPDDICNLSALRFLDISFCRNLESLPNSIGKLLHLQYLNLMGLPSLLIPLEVSLPTSLERLELQTAYGENSGALKGLANLMELAVIIVSETGEQEIAICSATWLEMKHLSLSYESTGANMDLPPEMQKMKKLESFQLLYYSGVNMLKTILPDWICDFHELERLELIGCDQLKEIPPLERLPKLKYLKFKECSRVKYLGIGSSSIPDGFPMLERLDLISMFQLEGMVSLSSNTLRKGNLLHLRILKIKMCPKLKTLPMGMDSLPNLVALIGEEWWWNRMIWQDHFMKTFFYKLFRELGT